MFPPSYQAVENVYKIKLDENIVPRLLGLIRYDHRNKYIITPKSTHIRNQIKSITTHITNRMYFDVTSLTTYENRKYKTNQMVVVNKFIMITKDGL